MEFVAGVDTHRDTHEIAFLDSVGHIVKSISIQADQKGYTRALDVARELGEVVWGIESTGCYGKAFARALIDTGACVYEVPGSFTKRHRQRSSRTGKSDALDAQAIAETVLREVDRLPRYAVCAEREGIRLRFEQRDRLVTQRTEAVNRMRSAALRLDVRGLPSELTAEMSLAVMERHLKRFRSSPDLETDALVDDIRFAIEDVRRLNKRIKGVENLLRPLIRRVAPELLELRGVATIVAAGLIGHSGDLQNCRNADAFAMRAGTAPVSCSSGKRSAVRVNTGGNRQLNRLIHVIALTQIRATDHAGKKYYDRKRVEGKTARAALRALKRRLSVVLYYRLKSIGARFHIPQERIQAA